MSGPPLVLVAPELADFAGVAPEWPAGAETRLGAPAARAGNGDDGRVVALLPLVSQPVGPSELARFPALRVVANYGVGYDNLDLEALRAAGVAATNTPDVLTDATADLAMALVLVAARRLREGLDLARGGTWSGWHPTQLLGAGLRGRTLGLAGAGRIGCATARRARGFGLDILYWNRSPRPALETELEARRAGSLGELLEGSDIVSVHLPLTEETRGLLDAAALARMRRGAILVNTARGAVVDEAALAAALREGRLAAAGLDVFAEEPRVPPALRELPNCFVLPHLGSATREARTAMWDLAAANVRAVLRGESPPTPIQPATTS
ncbi:MAG: D-glycerate dehydrogenase [Gemmatimonadota bacterium]|nr:D-glycerate dehydrogenase [Gemmatimonadota bacterium]